MEKLWEELNKLEEDPFPVNDTDIDFENELPWDPTKEEEAFGEDLYDLIQGIVDKEEPFLTEEFVSDRCATNHFQNHCITRNRASSRSNVYYDFRDVSKYKEREKYLTNELSTNNNYGIISLTDIEYIQKVFRKFFEGGRSITFSPLCGFRSSKGRIGISIHAYSTEVTRNYHLNTLDFIIKNVNGRTITMYPIDANYLESKLNNIIKNNFGDRFPLLVINH